MDEDFDEMEEDPLASAIQTKWEGAAVSWDSVLPYVQAYIQIIDSILV